MENRKEQSRTARIGLLVTVALVILMLFLFFIGSEQQIFSRKYEYRVRMDSVSGLAEGNPVELAGVTIGTVSDIFLPRDPAEQRVDITISVDRKFADRIRQDSRARIRKLGLIAADSYVDITPGSPEEPALPPGSIIPAQRATDVDKLIASGEDLVDNFVQISYSLKNVLQRIDRGEGLLGELTTEPETQQRLTDTILTTLNRTNSILRQVESGEGVVGKLVYDDQYADELTGSVASAARSLQSVTVGLEESFRTGSGILPVLLNDPEGREKINRLTEQLEVTTDNLAIFSQALSEGRGLLPRLLSDEPYADETLQEFHLLVRRLNETARMLQEGEGTAGRIIADPAIYEAINDVLIGINESKLLRWLIRSRQRKGIEARYEAAQTAVSEQPTQAAVNPPSVAPASPDARGSDGNEQEIPETEPPQVSSSVEDGAGESSSTEDSTAEEPADENAGDQEAPPPPDADSTGDGDSS